MDYSRAKLTLIRLWQEDGVSGAALGRAMGVSRSQANHILRGTSETTWERLQLAAPLVGRRIVHALVQEKAAGAVDLLLDHMQELPVDDVRRVLRLARVLVAAEGERGRFVRTIMDADLDGWERAVALDDKWGTGGA